MRELIISSIGLVGVALARCSDTASIRMPHGHIRSDDHYHIQLKRPAGQHARVKSATRTVVPENDQGLECPDSGGKCREGNETECRALMQSVTYLGQSASLDSAVIKRPAGASCRITAPAVRWDCAWSATCRHDSQICWWTRCRRGQVGLTAKLMKLTSSVESRD